MATTTILIADDEDTILNMLSLAMTSAGYNVLLAHDGVQALAQIKEHKPDLVLLDLQMPRMDGFTVCRSVKSDVFLRHIPVIMLTAQNQTQTKVTGLEAGADDYVTKPFDLDELLARLRTILRRTRLGLEANPLTRLPGNVTIEKEILRRIEDKAPFAVLYLDLNSFKAYNDIYGFVQGDEVIKETAKIILSASKGETDFVGHIGGDDFVVVSTPDRWEMLSQTIIERFDAKAPSFYNDEDRARGYIETKDRKGQMTRFPLLSIAIGVVSNMFRPMTSLGEVSHIGAEMKHFAKEKKDKGSSCALDRRKD